MEIKRVENLSKDECREYLLSNPNGELAKEVHGRLNAILAAEEKARQRKEAERKASVILKNKWIDINQFLGEKKYKNLRTIRYIFLFIFFLYFGYWLKTIYYTYRDFPSWSYVFDLMEPVKILYLLGIPLSLYFLLYFFHSPLKGQIYNIEDGSMADKYRPIQNKKGKCGLCQLGRTRLKRLLPFQYDLICPAKENSFICCKESKYGVYNAATRKMVIPVIYDEVYSLGESIIKLVKNGEIHIFSYKGYRIIESYGIQEN